MTRAIVVLLTLLLARPASAGGVTFAYDSFPVAAGAAIDSGVRDVGTSNAISCVVDNTTAAARNFEVRFLSDDGGTVLFTFSVAVAIGTKAGFDIGHGSSSTATPVVNSVPLAPFRKMQFVLVAGGATTCRVTCQGRF